MNLDISINEERGNYMKAIVAIDQNWGIGKDNKLLFKIPKDLERFKALTINNIVIMGRNTYDSLNLEAGLPDRTNIVLSHRPINSSTIRSCVFDGFIFEPDENTDNVFVIGGASIYELLLPYCDTVYVTKVLKNVEHDRKMINLDVHPDWILFEDSKVMSDINQNTGEEMFFMYCTYTRVRISPIK